MAMARQEIIEYLERFSDNRYQRIKGVSYWLERDFMTVQCNVMVFQTDVQIFGDMVYCIVSRHLNNDDVNVRFGNREQINSIVNTYVIQKEFKLEDYQDEKEDL